MTNEIGHLRAVGRESQVRLLDTVGGDTHLSATVWIHRIDIGATRNRGRVDKLSTAPAPAVLDGIGATPAPTTHQRNQRERRRAEEDRSFHRF